MSSIQEKTVEQLAEHLLKEIPELDEEVVMNIRKHKVDGNIFLQLDEEYLDRLRLKKMIASATEPLTLSETSLASTPSEAAYSYLHMESRTPTTPSVSSVADDTSFSEVILN